jgi:hypothetical protein
MTTCAVFLIECLTLQKFSILRCRRASRRQCKDPKAEPLYHFFTHLLRSQMQNSAIAASPISISKTQNDQINPIDSKLSPLAAPLLRII